MLEILLAVFCIVFFWWTCQDSGHPYDDLPE